MDQATRWEDRYRSGDTPWDTGRSSPELMKVIAEEKIFPCKAIELGCGTGMNSIWLAQQGFEVTAMDISKLAIQKARDTASKVAVRFLVGDVLNPPRIEETFPFFFDRGCYHVVRKDNIESYLQTLDRITTPDAKGLILAGNANEPPVGEGPPVVSEDEIRNEIGKLFDIKWLREFRFDSPDDLNESFLAWSCFVMKN